MTTTSISRFAPSPTGLLHVGNIRIALLNFLYTKSRGGKFILRIDDTDKERSNTYFEEEIINTLSWLGIIWDKSFKQSEHELLYSQAKEQLAATGLIYPCFETSEELITERNLLRSKGKPPIYSRKSLFLSQEEIKKRIESGEKPHWRFKIDYSKPITWHDELKGEININPQTISDPVLFKANGQATYTLATVVDDITAEITIIIRGDDHLTNSATHLQIFSALGCTEPPKFAHVPLVYNSTQEISKRIGGFDIKSLREEGIEAMAINSMMLLLGTANDVLPYKTIDELLTIFDLKKVNNARVHYDKKELDLLNEKYIKLLDYKDVESIINPIFEQIIDKQHKYFIDLEKFWDFIRWNIKKVKEVEKWLEICTANKKLYHPDDEKEIHTLNLSAELLPAEANNSEEDYKNWIKKIKENSNCRGPVLFKPLRMALTGLSEGPELYKIMCFMPREIVITRLINTA